MSKPIFFIFGALSAICLSFSVFSIWSVTTKHHRSIIDISGISAEKFDCIGVNFGGVEQITCDILGKTAYSFRGVVMGREKFTLNIYHGDKKLSSNELPYTEPRHPRHCEVDVSEVQDIIVRCEKLTFAEKLRF